MKEQSREICGSGWGTGNEGGEEMELKKGGGWVNSTRRRGSMGAPEGSTVSPMRKEQ